MRKIIFFLFFGLLLTNLALAQNQVDLYLFYGEGCPHCAKVKPYLESLKEKYPSLKIYQYEVWQDTVNQELFRKVANTYGKEPEGVPTVFIGDQVIIGYDESMNEQFKQAIEKCLQTKCPSPAEKIKLDDSQNVPPPQLNNFNVGNFFWFIIVAIFLALIISFLFRRKKVN